MLPQVSTKPTTRSVNHDFYTCRETQHVTGTKLPVAWEERTDHPLVPAWQPPVVPRLGKDRPPVVSRLERIQFLRQRMLVQSDITAFTTCLKPLPFLLLLFAESISVIQRGSVNDSRAAAFRHGAVVARKGSLVMNQYVQPPVQTIRSPVQL